MFPVIINGMARNLTAAYDDLGCACGVSVYTITNIDPSIDMFYLLGLLNSKLIDFYYKSRYISKHLARGYIGYNKGQIEQIPIIVANKSKQDKISKLVQDYILKFKVILSLYGKKMMRENILKKYLIIIKNQLIILSIKYTELINQKLQL